MKKTNFIISVFMSLTTMMQAGIFHNGLWFDSESSDDSFRYVMLWDCDLSGEVMIPSRFTLDARDWEPPLDCIVTGIRGDSFTPFRGKTNITAVVIPESVLSIGNSVFEGCTGLSIISVSWADPSVVSMGEGVFTGVNTGAVVLHVPVGSAAAYQASEQWSGFNIVDDGQIVISHLSALTVSSGRLSPAFVPEVQEYSVVVPQSVSSITIAATPAGSATVSGDGLHALQPGENSFTITVSQSNRPQRDYVVTVNRMAQDYAFIQTGFATTSSRTKYFPNPITNIPMYVSDGHVLRYEMITGSESGNLPLNFNLEADVSADRTVPYASNSVYEIELEIEIRMLDYLGDVSMTTHFDAYGRPSWCEIMYPNRTTRTISISTNSQTLFASEISLLSIPQKISFVKFELLQGGTAISSPEIQQITLYPNPVKDELNVKSGEWGTENKLVEIYDFAGKKVSSQYLNDKPVNVSSFPQGVYIIKIGDYRGKFVKE
jgi:hypothetical protein